MAGVVAVQLDGVQVGYDLEEDSTHPFLDPYLARITLGGKYGDTGIIIESKNAILQTCVHIYLFTPRDGIQCRRLGGPRLDSFES